MVKPETYHATTKSGKTISETAKDANTVIDYPSIKKAGYHVKEVARDSSIKVVEQIGNIKAGKETLSVNDKTLEPLIAEISDYVRKLPSMGVYETIDAAVSDALEKHDQLQREYNEEAEAKVKARAASEE